MSILFSIIIPTFNSCRDLEQLLMSLASVKDELGGCEVIVADDGSFDDTEMVVRESGAFLERLVYLYQQNRGPAAARNFGARHAQGQYLIFVDDDCLFVPESLQHIKNFYKHKHSFDGAGIRTVNHTKSSWTEFNERLGEHLMQVSRTPEETFGYVSSRCHTFMKESFWKVGGFDEDFIWPAAEDRDLCQRMVREGMRLTRLETHPLLNIDYLNLRAFIKQNYQYGLGAGLLMQKNSAVGIRRRGYFFRMVADVCRDRSFFSRGKYFCIFLLSQISATLGLISYKINFNLLKRPPAVYPPILTVIWEWTKNVILGFSLVKAWKNSQGSLTTGEELYSVKFLAASAIKTTHAYQNFAIEFLKSPQGVKGNKVLEIGPGSNFAVAFSLIAQGASHMTLVDKYGEVRFRAKEHAVYQQILPLFSRDQQERIRPLIEKPVLGQAVRLSSSLIRYYPDLAIEKKEILEKLSPGTFGLIVSTNTLEHIGDLERAFCNMKTLLRPGGVTIHKIDAGTHFALRRHTKNALSQYVYSALAFDRMFSNRDAPTRRVSGDYLRIVQEAGFKEVRFIVDETASENEMNSVRPFLDARFQNVSSEELVQTGFWIIARNAGELC